MASRDSLEVRKLLARGVVRQVADDQGVAIRLYYIGSGTVTSVTVTTATDIVLVTSDGGTDTYAFATYTTLGSLADAINAAGIFEARILDGIRAMSTENSAFVDGAITRGSQGYFDVLTDTSVADVIAVRLSYSYDTPTKGGVIEGHRDNLTAITYNVTAGGGADANSLDIYTSWGPNSSTLFQQDTLILQATPTSGSLTTLNWNSGNAYITGPEGGDIVVVMSDATSITGFVTAMGLVE